MNGEINIAGRKVPLWVIAVGVLGALGLFILTRITGGGGSKAEGEGEVGGDLDMANLSDQFSKALSQSNTANQKQIDALNAANAKQTTDFTKALADLKAYLEGKLNGGNPAGTPPASNVPYTPAVGPITPGSNTGGRTPGPDEKWVGIPDAIPAGVTLTKNAIGAIDVVFGNYTAMVRPSNGSMGGYAVSMPQYYGPTSSYPAQFKQGIQAAIHTFNPGFIGSYWD